jgi:hypothetical protein
MADMYSHPYGGTIQCEGEVLAAWLLTSSAQSTRHRGA